MRWPWQHPQEPRPSEDARHALGQARRQLVDTERLDAAADDMGRRADEIGDRWQETRRRNHVAEAVVESIRRRHA